MCLREFRMHIELEETPRMRYAVIRDNDERLGNRV